MHRKYPIPKFKVSSIPVRPDPNLGLVRNDIGHFRITPGYAEVDPVIYRIFLSAVINPISPASPCYSSFCL